MLKELSFKTVPNVPWQSVFNLAQFVTKDCDRYYTELLLQFDKYPSGKRSFMLALESYFFYKHALNRGYVTAHHHFEALYKCNDTLFEQFDEYTKQVNQHHYISDSDSFKRNQEESSKAIRKIVNESSIEQTEKKGKIIQTIMHNMGFYLAGVKYEFKGDDLLCSMLDSLVVENGSKKKV